ncbi:hypothetical protein DPMN_042454 [Dreissena polymorpha]|uniref:PARP4 MVP-ID C-terminal domain-containing protein n=1 Tax=Dreissena polymorpha TaxID=45954 RepID=A0A9D4HX21_DREPO|nr:hypothetical protein DPMN_042454 [Dreissena polymorpha]
MRHQWILTVCKQLDGYYDFTPNLGKLLGVDFQKCESILTLAGLPSLGFKAKSDILRLVATSIVIIVIRLIKVDLS